MERSAGRRAIGLIVALLMAIWATVVAARTSPAPRAAPAAVPAQQAPGGSASPLPLAPAQATAALVGSDTCLGCHDGLQKGYTDTAHGRSEHPRSPAANQGCESCHGPGSAHVDDPSVAGSIIAFTRVEPAEASQACLTCHARGEHALWDGSVHDVRDLSCVSCHSVHAFKSERAQLRTATERETCATCHRDKIAKLDRSGHMPVREGKMECSTCHDPHGSTNVKNLRVGNYVNESCVSCHTEKRGPFLFEHAAGRESCVSCHDPHGSSNDRMLVAKLPMLCQRCHVHTRHPGTMYDQVAVNNRSNRIIGRACVNCHQQIHGTNHPSGVVFVR